MILTLIFATIGLLAEFIVLFLLGFVLQRPDFLPHFLTSVAGLYVAALLLGSIVMEVACSNQLSKSRLNFSGLAVAWFTLLIQILFGVSAEYSRGSHESGAFVDYVFKPFFWVIFFGGLPVTALGLLYARRLEKMLKQT
jgi:hypothetical protein